jgi:hypothetical protein
MPSVVYFFDEKILRNLYNLDADTIYDVLNVLEINARILF